jgi:hypothetical protein
MNTFRVVQLAILPKTEWAVEWTEGSLPPRIIAREFSSAEAAQRWADLLNTVEPDELPP